jgi:hypothetical protein
MSFFPSPARVEAIKKSLKYKTEENRFESVKKKLLRKEIENEDVFSQLES